MWDVKINDIINDMCDVDSCYKPSHFWQTGSSRIQQDLDNMGIESFRSFPSALGYFVPSYRFAGWINQKGKYEDFSGLSSGFLQGDIKASLAMESFLSGRVAAEADYRVFAASNTNIAPYTITFSESDVGKPAEQFEFEGKRYSRSSLNYLLGLNFLKQQLGEVEVSTVLEIGGGFGSLGEILLSDPRNDSFYINVDIPPTCIFSSYYLKQTFGEDKVGDYADLKSLPDHSIDSLRQQFKAIVICPWTLPDLIGKVDLFVNFISFQEMEPDIVKNYLNEVDRLESRFVLLRNLREGKQVAINPGDVGVKTPILGEDYDDFLPNYELVATNVSPFGFKTVDGFHSELRLYRRR